MPADSRARRFTVRRPEMNAMFRTLYCTRWIYGMGDRSTYIYEVQRHIAPRARLRARSRSPNYVVYTVSGHSGYGHTRTQYTRSALFDAHRQTGRDVTSIVAALHASWPVDVQRGVCCIYGKRSLPHLGYGHTRTQYTRSALFDAHRQAEMSRRL